MTQEEFNRRNSMCIMCMSATCMWNPEGVCMYPMVYGEMPVLADDGCDCWLDNGIY